MKKPKYFRHFENDQGHVFCTCEHLKNIILDYGVKNAHAAHMLICEGKTCIARFEMQEQWLIQMISLVNSYQFKQAVEKAKHKQI